MALLIVSIALAVVSAFAAPQTDIRTVEIKRSAVIKEVQGDVTWINARNIAVVFGRDNAAGTEEEILLPLSGDVRLEYLNDFAEIHKGDVVRIFYEESTETDDQGKVLSEVRKPKTVRFIRRGSVKPPDPMQKAGADTLDSQLE